MAHGSSESLFHSAVSAVLHDQEHIKSLKPQQLTAMKAFLFKEDVFALLPTGFGKSLIYQLSPLVAKKMLLYSNPVVVVVCPLVALMEQQVQEASKLGLTAMQIGINSDREIVSGQAQLLFGSPEAWLLNDKWRRLLSTLDDLVGIVVDEVHLTYKWGQAEKGQSAFRECFARLGELRSIVKAGTPILALTASADVHSRTRVIRQLHLENAITVIESPNRTNIRLGVSHISGPHLDCLDWIVQEVKEKGLTLSPIIIYCRTLKVVGRVFCYLKAELGEDCWVGRDNMHKPENMLIGMFHSKTLPHNKSRVLSSLGGEGHCKVVVATTALGMGLNFPRISHVVMYGVPEDVEAIVQEIGRAGRDGTQSHAVIYCIKQHTKVDQVVKGLLNASRQTCFRKALYSHFDENVTALMPGHLCCTYCHTTCLCHPEGCKESTPVYELSQRGISAQDVCREVTEDDRLLLRDLLEQYQTSLVQEKEHLYTSKTACTGYGSELINAVVEHSKNIFDLKYIMKHLPVFKMQHAHTILHIINEVFEDIGNYPTTSSTPPDSIFFPDVDYTGYFDEENIEQEHTSFSSSESGVIPIEYSD